MSQQQLDELHNSVRDAYGRVAEADDNGCGCGVPNSCCGTAPDLAGFSIKLGYSEADLQAVPGGSDMGLGCGNPKAIASLQPGEVVVDLGSGGGFDCFLAAREVGDHGRVIGIDMTPAMLSKARKNAAQGGYTQVEFRLGEIEFLPVANDSADVVISNCVINLSPDKLQVFHEAWRILKPGGRLAISDVVASCELPAEMRADLDLHSACVAGASLIDELHAYMQQAGFVDIVITPKDESKDFIRDWAPGRGVEDYVVSAYIQAVKPSAGSSV
ncbi:MAG: arsenite methyltransferase [Chromatiales bacterium]